LEYLPGGTPSRNCPGAGRCSPAAGSRSRRRAWDLRLLGQNAGASRERLGPRISARPLQRSGGEL